MRLLIPTDFSLFSEYALKMGINIAKTTGGEIHLLHCLDHLKALEKVQLEQDKQEELLVHVERWAQEKLELVQREVGNHGIACKTILRKGALLENLKEVVDKESYQTVIMGSHGASGKEEWFLGSQTTKAIRKLHTNVLVVKEPVDTLDFSEVVFVTGLNMSEQFSFKVFLDFIKPFNVKEIHILSVDTFRNYSQPSIIMRDALQDFKNLASGINVQTHFYPDYSIQAGIRHFTEEYKIDLIGMSNHVRHPLKRIFLGSNLEMLVNRSKVPVLSIDYK